MQECVRAYISNAMCVRESLWGAQRPGHSRYLIVPFDVPYTRKSAVMPKHVMSRSPSLSGNNLRACMRAYVQARVRFVCSYRVSESAVASVTSIGWSCTRPSHRTAAYCRDSCTCSSACACMRTHVRACVHTCVHTSAPCTSATSLCKPPMACVRHAAHGMR